jgi:RNA polymerase subunit RPABC4/transcription elongation factor Spt4
MYCKNCGKQIADGTKYCPECGTNNANDSYPNAAQPIVVNVMNSNSNSNINNNGYSRPLKSKVVAALLCFFLGGLGIHRFYVGKIGTGIIFLLTAGLFGIGALIDFIVILCGGFRDSLGQPLA